MLCTAWNDLLDYVGRGNPGLQARNTIPRFFYVESQGRTYREQDQGRAEAARPNIGLVSKPDSLYAQPFV